MKRREFLRAALGMAAGASGRRIAGAGLAAPALIGRAEARTDLPLASLKAGLDPADAQLVLPADPGFDSLRRAYNVRTLVRPQAIVRAKTPRGAATVVQWARANKVPFAVRGGGHSYEGFSQSDTLVLDTRLMSVVKVDARARMVSVGGGAELGKVYTAVAAHDLAMAGGSCPTVGVAGNTLGGGYGFLARRFGLSCDSLMAVEMVDAAGRIVIADASTNPDLLWAGRGGGGGSFGVVTRFDIRCHRIEQATVFGATWQLPAGRARDLMKAWQAWAPRAPDQLTSILRIAKYGSGRITLRCAGQWTGSGARIETELAPLLKVGAPSSALRAYPTTFLGAVRHFTPPDEPVYMKGKSDYLIAPMSDAGIDTLLDGLRRLPAGALTIICDAYGGAIARIPQGDTAFAHRAALYSLQYYAPMSPGGAVERLSQLRALYAAMRPFVSGGAYVNYPDLDLADAPAAYWGSNLARLKRIKAAIDPDNVFSHAQGVRP